MEIRIVSKWHGAKFEKLVHAGLGRNLADAAITLRDEIRADISIVGVPVARRSDPGESPRIETGALLKSYFAFTDRKALMAQVGSPLVYARYLEEGTSKMAPRPHIRSTLYGKKSIVARLVRKIT